MLKKVSLSFYAAILSAILGIVALALYYSNISTAYFANKPSSLIIGCTVGGIVLMILYAVLNLLKVNTAADFVVGLFPAAATFCLFYALTSFLSIRVYSMAIIYGSSLEANNASAQSAMLQAMIALVIYLLAAVAAVVAGFTSAKKEAPAPGGNYGTDTGV